MCLSFICVAHMPDCVMCIHADLHIYLFIFFYVSVLCFMYLPLSGCEITIVYSFINQFLFIDFLFYSFLSSYVSLSYLLVQYLCVFSFLLFCISLRVSVLSQKPAL